MVTLSFKPQKLSESHGIMTKKYPVELSLFIYVTVTLPLRSGTAF